MGSAGWRHDGGQLRYFDGEQWTEHYASPMPPQQRTERLDAAVAEQIHRRPDVRVESRTPFQAVLVYGSQMSGGMHLFYAVLTVFTCGLFVIPWIYDYSRSGERRTVMSVDQYGNIT